MGVSGTVNMYSIEKVLDDWKDGKRIDKVAAESITKTA
jgi:hypothetical protein